MGLPLGWPGHFSVPLGVLGSRGTLDLLPVGPFGVPVSWGLMSLHDLGDLLWSLGPGGPLVVPGTPFVIPRPGRPFGDLGGHLGSPEQVDLGDPRTFYLEDLWDLLWSLDLGDF